MGARKTLESSSKMKTFFLVLALATIAHARNIQKRQTQTCFGGNCGQNNAGGVFASQSCIGANCKQNNAGGAVGNQNCAGGNCGQNNGAGAQGNQNCFGAQCSQNNGAGALGNQHCANGKCNQNNGGAPPFGLAPIVHGPNPLVPGPGVVPFFSAPVAAQIAHINAPC